MLVKLAAKTTDPGITPVRLATTPATAGEELVKPGFGRTKTEWMPDKLHTGTYTVTSTMATTVDFNGSDAATVCKGDAGGPALRTVNGTTELVAINSRSWQGGCFGNDPAETRTGASTPVLMASATGAITPPRAIRATSQGDGKADLAAVKSDGILWVCPGTGKPGMDAFPSRYQVGTNWGPYRII